MKKVVSAVMITLLVASMTTVLIDIRPVQATGTIYIRADGRIDPPTANLTTADNVTYTFTGNNHASMMVERDDVVVDGAGYALQGAGSGTGFAHGSSNVTIRNATIQNFHYGITLGATEEGSLLIVGNTIAACQIGILLDSARGHSIIGNTIVASGDRGIALGSAANNSISGNTITDSDIGISLMRETSANVIAGNHIEANRFGINLGMCSDNVLRANVMVDNAFNFMLGGPATNDVDASNTVDGKPVYYWVDRHDMAVPVDAGYVALVDCTNIVVADLALSRNGEGIFLMNTDNSTVIGNAVTHNILGIVLVYSSYNRIQGNNVADSSTVGLVLGHSSYNRITENTLVANTGIGLLLEWSSNNRIYHNNFIGFGREQSTSSVNLWDNGYPSGGNYREGYTDVDIYKGPHQNATGSDGVWDQPYVIDADNGDRYPLTTPFGGAHAGDVDGDHDVDISDIVCMVDVYGVRYPHPHYDRLCDLDLDGDIDIFDIIIAVNNYGESW